MRKVMKVVTCLFVKGVYKISNMGEKVNREQYAEQRYAIKFLHKKRTNR